MGFGDLPREREAETVAFYFLPSRGAVEGLENLFPIPVGDALAGVADGQDRRVRRAGNFDLDRERAVIVRIFQKVPDEPVQQARVAGNFGRRSGQGAVRVAGAFLRHQRDEVDGLRQIRVRSGIQTAHQEDFVD